MNRTINVAAKHETVVQYTFTCPSLKNIGLWTGSPGKIPQSFACNGLHLWFRCINHQGARMFEVGTLTSSLASAALGRASGWYAQQLMSRVQSLSPCELQVGICASGRSGGALVIIIAVITASSRLRLLYGISPVMVS